MNKPPNPLKGGPQMTDKEFFDMVKQDAHTREHSNETRKDYMKLPLSEVNKLEKRMGVRVWDGVLFNQDGITNPMLTVLNNKTGLEIKEILNLNNQ